MPVHMYSFPLGLVQAVRSDVAFADHATLENLDITRVDCLFFLYSAVLVEWACKSNYLIVTLHLALACNLLLGWFALFPARTSNDLACYSAILRFLREVQCLSLRPVIRMGSKIASADFEDKWTSRDEVMLIVET